MKKVFATNLRKVRTQLGWKTSLVASGRLGIKRSTYQSYEEGRAMPAKTEALLHLAEVMGISDLLGFITNPNFDYKNQGATKIGGNTALQANYRAASERDKKLVDQILGIPVE